MMNAHDIQIRSLLGTTQKNYLRGFIGNDVINGYEEDDLLEGAAGDDILIGGLGNDVLKGEFGNDSYQFGLNWGVDTLIDLTGKSIIRFGKDIARENLVIVRDGDNVTITDARNNSSIFFTAYSRTGDQAYLNSEIEFDNGDKLTLRDFLIEKLTCTSDNDTIRGTSLDDTIVGLLGNDNLTGNVGDDFLQGDGGNDSLDGGEGDDTIFGGVGNDILLGGAGNDTYRFGRNQGSDFLIDRTAGVGVDDADKIVLDADVLPANVSLYRTSSVDSTYFNGNNVDDLVLVIDGSNEQLCIADYFSATEDMAVESIVFGNGVVWTKADILAKLINQSGTVSNFVATTGDDTFTVDHSLDQVSGDRGGHDRVVSSVSYELPSNFVADIELSGVLNLNASSWGSGTILGNSGDNILRKNGLGDFYYDHANLMGGKGNDHYFARGFMDRNGAKLDEINADKIIDTVMENANEGYDTVTTTAYNATLPANVEKLIVSGEGMYAWYFPTSTYIVNHFNGNELDNVIDASGISSGNPIIDGGLGKDIMIGGGGDDTFIVDNSEDVVIETLLVNRIDPLSAFKGDTIEASVSYTLPANVENLSLTGVNAIDGTGNGLNNRLDGSKNSSVNHLSGGLGDDTYIVDISDVIHENVGGGNDTVAFNKPGNYLLSSHQQIENIALEDWAYELNGPNSVTGSAADNTITGNSASNTLIGGAGNDVIYDCSSEGSRKIDSRQYGLVNDEDQLIGGLGNDTLISYSGTDTLDGGEGDDSLAGGKGDTIFVFGHGYGHDHLVSDAGDRGANYAGDRLLLTQDVYANEVIFNRNGSTLSVGLHGTSDIFDIDNFFVDQSSLQLNNTIEKIVFADGSFWDSSMIIARLLSGNANLPTTGNDLIAGSGADDVIDALDGNDVVQGDSGNDTLKGDLGDDSLYGGLGNDTLIGGVGNDVLIGGSGADTYRFSRGFGQDFVEEQGTPSATDLDTIIFDSTILPTDVRVEFGIGESESAIYLKIKNTQDQIILRSSEGKTSWSTYYLYQNGVERVQFADGTTWNVQDLLDKATANINHAPYVTNGIRDQAGKNGSVFNFTVPATSFSDMDVGDTLTYSAALADGSPLPAWLSFNPTTRTFNGTLNTTETIYLQVTVEDSGKLQTSTSFAIYLDQDQTISGTAASDALRGGIGNDMIYGLAGNDTLYGGYGSDTLVGGLGDDYYSIEDEGDVIVESLNEGDDFVRSSASYTLSDNVERLALDGGSDLDATGNALNNGLWGNEGSNVLTGAKGNDYVSGGLGNDTYVFNRGDGQDTIDNKDLIAATDAVRFAGNIIDTEVVAVKSGNTLFLKIKGTTDQIGISNYYAANTTLNGEAADYKIDKVEFSNAVTWNQAMIQTMVDRAANNKAPTLGTAVPNQVTTVGTAYTLTIPVNTIVDTDVGDSVSYNLKMQDGSALPSWLSFNSNTRLLSGIAAAANVGTLNLTLWGTDNFGLAVGQSLKMTVNAANRTPVLAVSLVDQTAPLSSAFTYTVPSTSFTDPDAGDVLTYTATLADGSALPSWLSFNAGTRTFSGTPSTMGTISVKVTAKDTGNLSVSDVFDVVVNVANLTLTGTSGADTLTGGAGNDTLSGLAGNDKLTGNAGNDVLDGGVGTDTLQGGLGDDTYVVDVATDVVTENLNEGIDTVKSSVTLTLANNVENLTLTGATAINGTGNALNNVLTGNSAVNALDGGVGADTLAGGAGNDIYTVDNLNDVIVENANEGADQVNSSITYTLSANVENLTLTGTSNINATGNAAANVLTGNAGNNVLDGGVGNDSMVGGAGNDTYVVDSSSDTVTEAASAGTDLVQSSVSYTLGTNLENLTLTGTANINATGNTAANILFGNSGNNVLDGGTGADTMTGGAGNDIYVRDNASDVITENANEGVDQVKSSLTYTLIANLEALLLTGSTAINGTGNELDNLLTGNSGKNVLNGAAGNDILQGGAGDDTLTDTAGKNIFDGGAGIDLITAGIANDFIAGGLGNDTITTGTGVDVVAFNRGDGMDTLVASTGKDNTLSLGKGIKYADLLFKKSGNDLILVTGTSEQVTMKDWYTNVNNRSIANLQIVIEGTTDYNAASTNKLNNKKIGQFNFDGLAAKFDQARAANPSLTSWALSSSLLEFYLAGSDTSAIGGDLAYQYAKVGNLSGFSMIPALNIISNAQYGSTSQTLQPVSSLKDTTVSLV
jgi:Ca2+-binding RTX toxin-like protein